MNQKEILRYLGASCREPQLEGMIGQAWEKVVRAASPRYVSGRFSLVV